MIKIITDSAADIPAKELAEGQIEIMSIPITVDGVTYREGRDFTSEEYYQMLAAAKSIPVHAQVTMLEYSEAFRKAIKEGYNNIICVTITSKGSGMYDAACLAKKVILEEQPVLAEEVTIDVIDSKGYTYVYGLAVVAAARAVKEGKSRDQVLEVLRQHLDGYQAIVGLTNLSYAKHSGRITTVAAFVGEVMGFRPILRLVDGELKTEAKVRGDGKLIEALAQKFLEESVSDGRPYYIICADCMDNAQELKKLISKGSRIKCAGIYRIGGAVTTNAGPTVFGFIMPKAISPAKNEA